MTEFLADMVVEGTAFTFIVIALVLGAAWAWAQRQDERYPPGEMG